MPVLSRRTAHLSHLASPRRQGCHQLPALIPSAAWRRSQMNWRSRISWRSRWLLSPALSVSKSSLLHLASSKHSPCHQPPTLNPSAAWHLSQINRCTQWHRLPVLSISAAHLSHMASSRRSTHHQLQLADHIAPSIARIQLQTNARQSYHRLATPRTLNTASSLYLASSTHSPHRHMPALNPSAAWHLTQLNRRSRLLTNPG